MKKKDIIYLLLAVVILIVAGYVGYTQLVPKKDTIDRGVEVDKIGVFDSKFDTAALVKLGDAATVHDYSSPVDLTGLDNKAPFGP